MVKSKEIRYQKQKEHFEWLRDEHEPPIRQADIRRAAGKSEERQSLATTTTVGNWYRGEKQISRDNAEWLISEFGLDVTVEWLRGESDYMNDNYAFEANMLHYAKTLGERNVSRRMLFEQHAKLAGWSVSYGGYTMALTHDSKPPVMLTEEDYEALCDKLIDFFDFELEHRERKLTKDVLFVPSDGA